MELVAFLVHARRAIGSVEGAEELDVIVADEEDEASADEMDELDKIVSDETDETDETEELESTGVDEGAELVTGNEEIEELDKTAVELEETAADESTELTALDELPPEPPPPPHAISKLQAVIMVDTLYIKNPLLLD